MPQPDGTPPSGEQHEIRLGGQVAVVTEVGATLRSYTVGGLDIVDGFAVDEHASAGRGQVLAPWPNRLDGGRFSFDGVEGRAPLDEPELGNAIHGVVRWLPWLVASKSENAVLLECVLHPQPAYPWRLELGVEYRLGPGGLSVGVRTTNTSGGPAPFGIGFHPYLTVGVPIDGARLTIAASRRLVTDERALPIGAEDVAGTDFDFTSARQIGSTELDTCFSGLGVDRNGRSRTRVEAADRGRGVELWADEVFGYLMVYTGDTLAPAVRRRRAIAVEPMTCPPNALATGTDLITLEPGASWRGAWGIVAQDPAG